MGTALVTGATSGIGLEIAWQLAAARHRLVLVARDAARLDVVANQIRAAAAVEVEVLSADLATEEGRETVVARLRQAENPVGLLVNNAGFGPGQRFVTGDLAVEERAVEVMIRAVLVLTKAAVEGMVERGHGAILNVASVAAFTLNGTYSAAKAWVVTFTEALAAELEGTGVTATALCPGLVRTEFHERAGLESEGWPDAAWVDVDHVAAAGLRGVRRGDTVVVPSLRYKTAATIARHLPRRVLRKVAGPGSSQRRKG